MSKETSFRKEIFMATRIGRSLEIEECSVARAACDASPCRAAREASGGGVGGGGVGGGGVRRGGSGG